MPDYGGYGTDLPPLLNNKNIEEGNLAAPAKTVDIIGLDDPYGTTIANGLKESLSPKLVGRWWARKLCRFRTVTDWRTKSRAYS